MRIIEGIFKNVLCLSIIKQYHFKKDRSRPQNISIVISNF